MKLKQRLKQTFTIKQIIKDHCHSFLSLGYDLRPSILKNVQKLIRYGDPSFGYALYSCSHCGKIKHVPFCCKSPFCNTCGASYVANRAKRNLINLRTLYLASSLLFIPLDVI